MPRIRSKGLVGIIQGLREEASGAADALHRVGEEARFVGDEAERIASVQPAGIAPPVPGPPGSIPPGTAPGTILGPAGSPIAGSTRSSGATSGGSGVVGAGRTGTVRLRELGGSGRTASLAWVQAHCQLITITVPTHRIGHSREVPAWDCGPFGTYVDPREGGALSTTSARSSGGAGSSSGASDDLFALQADPNRNQPQGRGVTGPLSTEERDRRRGGPSSSSQGISTSGIEQRLDRTNSLLEKAVRGDGGAGFRAEGGF